MCAPAFSRRMASEFCLRGALEFVRGRREGRVPAGTHGPRAAKKHAAEPQVQPEQPAFPAQWFYGLYVISSVNRAFLPPSPARRGMRLCGLSASVGAPGPHDFAVRDTSFVS